MLWPLESHRRAWEGEAGKKRRQKISVFPADLWIEALSPVFVVALLELKLQYCLWGGEDVSGWARSGAFNQN